MIRMQRTQTAPVVMLIAAVVCAMIAGVSLLWMGNLDWTYGFLFAAVFSVLLSAGAAKRPEITNAILIAYIVRLGMFVLCTLKNDSDADYYAVYAAQFAAMPWKEFFASMPKSAYWYSWIVSFFFRAFGTYFTPVRAMNLMLSMCCVYITVDLAELIYHDQETTKRVAMWMALFPNLIRFSSYFANREPMLMLFMLLYLKYSYRYYTDSKVRNLVLAILFLIPALILHTSMITMIFLTVLIILTRESRFSHKALNVFGKAFLAAVTVGAFSYMLANGIGTEKFGVNGGVELSISGISSIGGMSASGRAAYLKDVSFTNPILTLLFLPVRMLYFLYTPFVWMVSESVDLLGLFDAMLYVYLTVYVLRKMRTLKKCPEKSREERFALMLIFVLVVAIAMFAAVTSNYGTAIRHRCKLFPLILLIVADELGKSKVRIKGVTI